MANNQNFPVVDFSDFGNRYDIIAKEVLEACRTIGFFYIKNHNGPTSLQFKRAFEMSEAFFTQPTETKIRFGKFELSCLEGYISLTPQRVDDKEIVYDNDKEQVPEYYLYRGKLVFDILPLSKPQNLPFAFQDNKQELDAFYKGMHSTVMNIFELLAFALQIPANPETGANDYLSSRHRYEKPFATSILRFLRYPSVESTGRDEEVVASAHTDYGSITLLSQRDIAGLQVEIDGVWTEIPKVDDAILVNVGGALEYWTRGLLKGALHRVVATPELQANDRYSIAFFVVPETNTMLTGMPSPLLPAKMPDLEDVPTDRELTSDEYMMERFKSSSYLKRD
ncbi:hypothetical protein BDB00DRAFT_875590 [Zychaea mexicana]|uniref:uncharacterized protein n=1 Tax=Zychaea mexicana TaxID=64656 RepID=UPI0022FE3F5F|nr:uncharacterized protein BDB00DRAFT_875590 [Zychaea mexicana]KAI9490131.1 hypothetical protein BDB00DRAFT_875590 [Zychaea mexicana]